MFKILIYGSLLSVLLSAGCAPGNRPDNVGSFASNHTPYVSHLDEPGSKALYHYTRARLLLADGETDAAVEAYANAIDYDQGNDELRFELAELYIALEQPKLAMRVVEDVLLRNPDSIRALLTLGNAYFGNRQPALAVPYFSRALELDQDLEQVRLHLAIALMRSGEVAQASDALKELLSSNPASKPARLALARLYRETELNLLAEEQYQELIRRYPEMSQAQLELGLLYEDIEEWASALNLFRQMQQQAPLDFTLRHHVARVLVGMKRYDEALEELNLIVELKPEDFDARRKIGLLYLEQQRWDEAIAVFVQVLELNPNFESARYYLGTAYENNSEWSLALEAFQQIDSESSLYDDAISHISYLYLEMDRMDDAIALLELRLAETDPRPRPQLYYSLISLYMSDNRLQEAMAVAAAGVDLYPEDIELMYQKGLLLERSQRHAEATECMLDVLALNPDHVEALNFLAYSYAEDNRDLDEALQYAERAIALQAAPHILDTLGWVYYRLGRLEEALSAIEQASRQLLEDAVILEHLGDIHLALSHRDKARISFEKVLMLDPDNATVRDKLNNLIVGH